MNARYTIDNLSNESGDLMVCMNSYSWIRPSLFLSKT